MSQPAPSPLLARFRRLHLRAGLVALPLLALLLLSGVALNHSDRLGLVDAPMPRAIAGALYGYGPMHPVSFDAGGRWVTRLGSTVYLELRALTACAEGELGGAAAVNDLIVLLCGHDLELITPEGDLVERIGTEHGLPPGVVAVGATDEESSSIYLRSNGTELFVLDLDTLSRRAIDEVQGGEIEWSMAISPPAQISTRLPEAPVAAELNMERLLLDLHSGRLFGGAGVLVVDLVSIVVALLLLSGAAMWYVRR